MNRDPDLSTALSKLLPPEVVLQQVWLSSTLSPLYPAETAHIAQALPKRRIEYTAGRHCARRALEHLIGWTGPLPTRSDRTPEWPLGVVGSITHDDQVSAAAVADQMHLRALGIDTDGIARVHLPLARLICTPTEYARSLAPLPSDDQQRRLAQIFTAKEAVYKAQHKVSAAWLNFSDLEITWPQSHTQAVQIFHACLLRELTHFPKGHVFTGHSAITDTHASASVLIPV